MHLMSSVSVRVLTVLLLAVSAAQSGLSATNVWTVTSSGEGHAVVDPADAKPGFDLVLTQAAAYLKTNSTSTLILSFPAGTYNFNSNALAVSVNGFTNGTLVIQGADPTNGAVLSFNSILYVGIQVNNSDRVRVERLHLTRTNFYGGSEFDVVSVNSTSAVLKVHSGFPSPIDLMNYNGWQGQEVTLLPFRYVSGVPQINPCNAKLALNTNVPCTDLGSGLYLANFKNVGQPKWGPGDMVALKIRTGQNTLRFFTNCNDCVARDLLITRFSGNPMRAFHNVERLLVERVVVDRPVGGIGGRIPFFSGADGGIQLYSRTDGPTVRDCTVIGTADDGIAVFSKDPDNPTANILIEGNTVADNQARGILITQSRDGICRNNTLVRNNMASIGIYVNSSDNNVNTNIINISNWLITGNTFFQAWGDPVISFNSISAYSNCMLIDNINIVSNRFVEAPKNNPMVYVSLSDHVRVDNNVIESFSTEDDWFSTVPSNALVYVKSGLNVLGTNNVCLWTARLPWQKEKPADNVGIWWLFQGLLTGSCTAGRTGLVFSNGTPGTVYYVQASTNLVAGSWDCIATNAVSADGVFQFNDSQAAGLKTRMYRVVQ